MAIRDEIRKERQAFLATATRKEKWNYFLEYYRLQIIGVLVLIAIVASLIFHAITDPEIVLNGLFINLYDSDQQMTLTDLGQGFLEEQDISTSKYDVSFGSGLTLIEGDDAANYQSSQALMVQVAAGTLDFIVGPCNVLLGYAYGGLFVDLSTVLSAEELALYQPYLHYVDGAVIERQQQAEDNFETLDAIELPDSTKPEEMVNPIPVFIDMSDSKKLSDVYGPYAKNLILGISLKGPNPENTAAFLKYLLK